MAGPKPYPKDHTGTYCPNHQRRNNCVEAADSICVTIRIPHHHRGIVEA
ncbi:hypothetical protein VCHC41A1_1934 [Vibrio cholerae HC-41A1]|nr:hypothetical protein VCCP104821_2744 [Vibrio cholerae CP1048(21)]EKG50999.1 hypothetical protein VCHC41A1_1934 [Vibrio cholerae HC-41A1]